ncbi:MAG: GNAT family N-acetyltransferase [Firmicutes bacterium]|nr:GNAT family N-acetyltransferase [Bacillota bacterium]
MRDDLSLLTCSELSVNAFGEMLKDYAAAGTPFLGMYSRDDYAAFERMCAFHSCGKYLPKGNTPYTRYFLCDSDGNIYAQGDVRHSPTPELTYYSGYIGYGVLPSMRLQGYGTLMCRLLLEKAARYYGRVIITCKSDNAGSRRIIEKNGGILLDIRYWSKRGAFMRRYAVDTPAEFR